MRSLVVYKPESVGWSTVPPNFYVDFDRSVVVEKARQMGMRTWNSMWLQLALQPRQFGGQRMILMARAVRFALENWHA